MFKQTLKRHLESAIAYVGGVVFMGIASMHSAGEGNFTVLQHLLIGFMSVQSLTLSGLKRHHDVTRDCARSAGRDLNVLRRIIDLGSIHLGSMPFVPMTNLWWAPQICKVTI